MSNALVCLHGFDGAPGDFAPLIERIQVRLPKYQVLSLDLYTQESLTPDHSIADWCANFESWLIQKSFESVHVVGYSMGGRRAVNWLLTRPLTCHRKVMALSARPGIWEPEAVSSRLRFDQQWAERFRELDLTELNRLWQELPIFRQSRAKALSADVNLELMALCFENWSPRLHTFEMHRLQAYQANVSWVFGGQDTSYQEVADRLSKMGATVENIEEGGHRLLLDAPDALSDLIVKQLAGSEI